MAAFNKFQKFSEDLAKGVHNLDAHVIRVYLSNAAPNVATHTVKTDIAEITAANGYAGAIDIDTSVARTGGVSRVMAVDSVVTAAGGSVGPFRYVVLFNDTAASDPLIGFWDYGASVTLGDGESFTIDVSDVDGILTVT
jgi:hypothetical protein